MTLVRFPPGVPVLPEQPYQESLLAEVDRLLADGRCAEGWFDVTTPDARLTCLIHQSKPHLAGLVEPEGFSWVPLRDFPVRARQMEEATCGMMQAEVARVLLMAVHFRNRPAVQATTDLIDLTHVLDTLARYGEDAAMVLERDGGRTLMFLQGGKPARIFFGQPSRAGDESAIENRFLRQAHDPDAPAGKVEVFKRLHIEPDPDAGRPLAELAAEAEPPPPRNLVVRLGGRVVTQRLFMPPCVTVGRDRSCELILNNLAVSRQHARVSWERGAFVVSDLGSVNGITVNGEKVERKAIAPGDRIGLGKFEIELVEPPEDQYPAATMMMPRAAGRTLYLEGDDGAVSLAENVTVGKARDNHLRARGFRVKKRHLRVLHEGPGMHRLVCEPGAAVLVNGKKLRRTFLHDGDRLVVGRSTFQVSARLAE